ncbi:hypothetical protein [Nostoc flagelliforme]|nr:hypothetical protein [Nostoc flagelliforme]
MLQSVDDKTYGRSDRTLSTAKSDHLTRTKILDSTHKLGDRR